MAVSWTSVTDDERWEGLSYDQKVAVREKYFESKAGNYARDDEHKEVLREQFYNKAVIDQPITDKVKKGAIKFGEKVSEINNTTEFKRREDRNAIPRSYTQQYNDETVRQGKQRINKDGSTTTVLSKTGLGPDGKWYNVPGFDRDTGKDYESDDVAIQAAMDDITSGKVKAYESSEAADLAAQEEHKELEPPNANFTVPMGADNYEIPMLPGKTQQESYEAFISDPANAATGVEGGADQPWPSGDIKFGPNGDLVSSSIPTRRDTIVRKAPKKEEKDEYSRYKPDRKTTGQIVDEPETTEQALDESYYGRPGKTVISDNPCLLYTSPSPRDKS